MSSSFFALLLLLFLPRSHHSAFFFFFFLLGEKKREKMTQKNVFSKERKDAQKKTCVRTLLSLSRARTCSRQKTSTKRPLEEGLLLLRLPLLLRTPKAAKAHSKTRTETISRGFRHDDERDDDDDARSSEHVVVRRTTTPSSTKRR